MVEHTIQAAQPQGITVGVSLSEIQSAICLLWAGFDWNSTAAYNSEHNYSFLSQHAWRRQQFWSFLLYTSISSRDKLVQLSWVTHFLWHLRLCNFWKSMQRKWCPHLWSKYVKVSCATGSADKLASIFWRNSGVFRDPHHRGSKSICVEAEVIEGLALLLTKTFPCQIQYISTIYKHIQGNTATKKDKLTSIRLYVRWDETDVPVEEF